MEAHEILLKFQDPASRFFANLAFNQPVRKMVRDHDDADDLTRDVFVKVWEPWQQGYSGTNSHGRLFHPTAKSPRS